MADTKPSSGQTWNKAREVLNGISHCRVDPTRITVKDTAPRIKGGQSAVIVGTLDLSELGKILFSELKRMLNAGELAHKTMEGSVTVPELRARLDETLSKFHVQLESLGLPSEAVKTALHDSKITARMLGMIPGALEEQVSQLKVAVKVLEWRRDDPEQSTKFFKSFVHEVSLMATLSHPNIIDLAGFVENMEKGDAWIILPWQEHGNVREFLRSGEWDIPERISLIQDTVKGLEYLHTHQPPICHGDLKSLNILVNSSYNAIITDFGSARIKGPSEPEEGKDRPEQLHRGVNTPGSTSPHVKFDSSTLDLTLTGPKFSLRWTAPEVLNDGMQDLPSDMWALGWICWEIITGRVPFEGLDHETTIILRTINGKLPAIREDSHFSHVFGLCSLMSDCWLSQPAQRIEVLSFRRKVGMMPSQTPSSNALGGQKVRSAELLINLAQMYESRGDRAMAESHYRSALDVATRTNEELTKASALLGLGEIYRFHSKYSDAEQASVEAQTIFSQIGHDMGAATALVHRGDVYHAMSKYQEAEKVYAEAHKIHSRIGYDLGIAWASLCLGHVYLAQLKHREAEGAFLEAYEIHSRVGSDKGAADALVILAELYRRQSRIQDAEEAFKEAYEVHSRIGDDMGTATALNGLGEIYLDRSRHHEAETAFREAHKVFSLVGDTSGVANALYGLGRVYQTQSKIKEAENSLSDAYKLYSATSAYYGAGSALRDLGTLYEDLGRSEEAEASYRQAITNYELGDPVDGKVLTLVALGKLQYDRNRYLEAEEALTEAHAIMISIDKESDEVAHLLSLLRIFNSRSRSNAEMDTPTQLEAKVTRDGETENDLKTHRL